MPKSEESQFKMAFKQEVADRIHEADFANREPGTKAAKFSDVMAKVDDYYPTFLKLYQTAGGLLVPAAAKPAADLMIQVLNGIKALGDNLAGTQPTPAV